MITIQDILMTFGFLLPRYQEVTGPELKRLILETYDNDRAREYAKAIPVEVTFKHFPAEGFVAVKGGAQ